METSFDLLALSMESTNLRSSSLVASKLLLEGFDLLLPSYELLTPLHHDLGVLIALVALLRLSLSKFSFKLQNLLDHQRVVEKRAVHQRMSNR